MNATVLVSASDTFRAAAVEQLQEWTDRAGVQIELPKGSNIVDLSIRSILLILNQNFACFHL